MRVATLLLCLALAACATGEIAGEQPAAQAVSSPAATATAPAASAPPSAAAPAAARPPAPLSESQRLTQVRVDCWMKVEHQKRLRDIDRRIAFVDKCVADAMNAPAQ